MLLNEEINRIKNLMDITEEVSNRNLFKNFDLTEFKDYPPPSDNSEETKKEIKYLKSGGTSEIPKNKMSDSDRKILSDLTNMKKETIKDKLLQLPYNLFFDALKNTFLTKDVQLVKDYVRAYIEKYPDAYRDFNFIDYLIELGEYYGIEKGYRW